MSEKDQLNDQLIRCQNSYSTKDSEAKSSLEELKTVRHENSMLHDEINKLKSEVSEALSLNKELTRSKDRMRDEFNRIKDLLDEERKELSEYKEVNEKNLSRVRKCLEEERKEFLMKVTNFDEELTSLRFERDELQIKNKQIESQLEMCRNKIKKLEMDVKNKDIMTQTNGITTHQQNTSQPQAVPPKPSSVVAIKNGSQPLPAPHVHKHHTVVTHHKSSCPLNKRGVNPSEKELHKTLRYQCKELTAKQSELASLLSSLTDVKSIMPSSSAKTSSHHVAHPHPHNHHSHHHHHHHHDQHHHPHHSHKRSPKT